MRDGFEWDPAKSDDCFERRGFDFYAASSIFQGTYVERFDEQHSAGEDRWIATGFLRDVLIDVIYSWRGVRRRIITAFPAGGESEDFYALIHGG